MTGIVLSNSHLKDSLNLHVKFLLSAFVSSKMNLVLAGLILEELTPSSISFSLCLCNEVDLIPSQILISSDNFEAHTGQIRVW